MRLGYCPQCGDQIMVQDVDGRWNSRRRNFGQAYIHFTSFKIKTFLCTRCAKTPDASIIINEILDDPNLLKATKTILQNTSPERVEII